MYKHIYGCFTHRESERELRTWTINFNWWPTGPAPWTGRKSMTHKLSCAWLIVAAARISNYLQCNAPSLQLQAQALKSLSHAAAVNPFWNWTIPSDVACIARFTCTFGPILPIGVWDGAGHDRTKFAQAPVVLWRNLHIPQGARVRNRMLGRSQVPTSISHSEAGRWHVPRNSNRGWLWQRFSNCCANIIYI